MAEQASKNADEMRDEVRSLIAEIIEIPEEEITDDSSFADDLEVDSLMTLEIVANIEKKYRIQIPEENLERVKTFNDTIELVKEFLE